MPQVGQIAGRRRVAAIRILRRELTAAANAGVSLNLDYNKATIGDIQTAARNAGLNVDTQINKIHVHIVSGRIVMVGTEFNVRGNTCVKVNLVYKF